MTAALTPERQEYHRIRYIKNKQEISEARKTKYRTEPEYRATFAARNRKSRQALASSARIRQAKLETQYIGNYRGYEENGVAYFTIGAFAEGLNCSEETIRDWEEKGVIPPCEHRSDKGDRLYTKASLLGTLDVLVQRGRVVGVESQGGQRVFVLAHPQPPRSARESTIRLTTGDLVKVPLYRVGVLAKRLGYAVSTIVAWEHDGLLPETPFRTIFRSSLTPEGTKPGTRFYTEGMIAACLRVLHGYRTAPSDAQWVTIKANLISAWSVLGVYGEGAALVT
jgi:DNA-binding transcriptional MerR regulator